MSWKKDLYQPPKLADRFLSWFCRDELLEEIKGDLHEFYLIERQDRKAMVANWIYWFHVMHFLRPFALRRVTQISNNTAMYKNYLIITLRNFRKNKLYSFLNLTGLTVGITSCLLIFLYVRDEYRFDRYHENFDNIYRVVTDFKLGDRELHRPYAPVLMAEHLLETVPEVENAGRLMVGMFDSVVDFGEKQMQIKNATYATSEVLEIFTFDFVAGSAQNALDEPTTVVMSESMAEHLFPGQDPIDQFVEFNNDHFLVKGIYKDMPDNGHFKFDFIMSVGYQTSRFEMGWMSINAYTYLLAKPGTDPALLEEKMNAALETYMAPLMESAFNVPGDQINVGGNHARFYLQPLADIHLKSNLAREIRANGSIENIRTISIIGVIILLIAGINFVNLSTARAALRAKEVGVRKVLGSKRKQLIYQFLFESTMYSSVAFVMAALLALGLLPYFNQLAGRPIAFDLGGSPPLWLLMMAAALVIGLVAGFYPAMILSAFSPGKSLKGQHEFKSGKSWLRSGLVVLQFAISTLLAIATLVINNQLDFVLNKPLGYDKDQLISLDIMDLNRYDRNEQVLMNELNSKPNIENFSRTGFIPVEGSRREYFLENQSTEQTINVQSWPVNQAYVPTLGMEILDGRNFQQSLASDTNAIVLNESAARSLQLENPVGQKLRLKVRGNNYDMHVIGVVKDFHFASMKEGIKPLLLYLGSDPWTISVRFTGSPLEAMTTLEGIWSQHSGGQPFVANLVGEQFRMQYQKESQLKGLVNSFSVLAVLVAILGLVGLAAFMAQQRKKEMGIRKVLGAKSMQIFGRMIGNFTWLIGLACLLAVPMAWWFTSQWLDEYAYRISLSPVFFVIACGLMLLLAWITVSFQSMKVARTNPVENLRDE